MPYSAAFTAWIIAFTNSKKVVVDFNVKASLNKSLVSVADPGGDPRVPRIPPFNLAIMALQLPNGIFSSLTAQRVTGSERNPKMFRAAHSLVWSPPFIFPVFNHWVLIVSGRDRYWTQKQRLFTFCFLLYFPV